MDPCFHRDDEEQPLTIVSSVISHEKEGRSYKRPSVGFTLDAEQEDRASCSACGGPAHPPCRSNWPEVAPVFLSFSNVISPFTSTAR